MACNAASSGTLPGSLAGRKAGKGSDSRADRDAPDIPDTPASLVLPALPARRDTPDIPGIPAPPVLPALPAQRDTPDIPGTPAPPVLPALPAQRVTPDIPGTLALPVPEALPAPPEAQDILALPAQWVPVEPWDRKGRFLPATAPAGAWAAAMPRCARPPACAPDFPGRIFPVWPEDSSYAPAEGRPAHFPAIRPGGTVPGQGRSGETSGHREFFVA